MRSVKVLIARFPQNRYEHVDVSSYLMRLVCEMMQDDRIGQFDWCYKADTPITMTRNQAVEIAQQGKYDLLLMVDNDMRPDMYADGKRFWDSSFNFWWDNHNVDWPGSKPCVIGAPYCGPPPGEVPYVFRWRAKGDLAEPQQELHLAMYTREEAYAETGIKEVAALPTGLILFDMRAFDKIPHPYFYYEYPDEKQIVKASTEDVANTRDLSLAGVPLYCNWDAWAGHWKEKLVGKPLAMRADAIPTVFRKQIEADRLRDEKRRVDQPGSVQVLL